MRKGDKRHPAMRWFVGGLTGVAALVAALQVAAALQDAGESAADTTAAVVTLPADSVDLVFEREVFDYPNYGRRNPFRPLTGEDMGPRFEDLLLTGVLVSLDRTRSIATIGERPPSSTQPPVRYSRLREGDVIGNTRIIEIRDRWVTVQVEEFGEYDLRTLELVRTAPEPVPGRTPAPVPAAPPAEAAPEDAGAEGATPAQTPPVQGMRPDSPNANGGWS